MRPSKNNRDPVAEVAVDKASCKISVTALTSSILFITALITLFNVQFWREKYLARNASKSYTTSRRGVQDTSKNSQQCNYTFRYDLKVWLHAG